MARVIKDPKERKTEILDIAEELFRIKGYETATTADILEKAGIARGTLYYHFKSKDEVMNAVVERSIERQIQSLLHIIDNQKLNAIEKIKEIIRNNQQINKKNKIMLDYLHKSENSVMHQKNLLEVIRKFSPLIAKVIHQGIEEKVFQTKYPLEVTQLILTGMYFLFDPANFQWNQDELITRAQALADIMETSLRAEKGTFDFLKHMFLKSGRKNNQVLKSAGHI